MPRPQDFNTYWTLAVDSSRLSLLDEARVRLALLTLYENPLAAGLFDELWNKFEAPPSQRLVLQSGADWQGVGGTNTVTIGARQPTYFDDTGTAKTEQFDRTLLHELLHLRVDRASFTGFWEDPHAHRMLSRSEWLGLTNEGQHTDIGELGRVETEVNRIFENIYTKAASYYLVEGGEGFGTSSAGSTFKLNESYTANKTIGGGVWLGSIDSSYRTTGGGDGTIDRSKAEWGATPFLLIGGVNNDLLRGGAGNDFLYGLEGRDTFVGGKGIDFIDGGHHQLPTSGMRNEVDTTDYRGLQAGDSNGRITIDFRDPLTADPSADFRAKLASLKQSGDGLLVPVLNDGTSAGTRDYLFDVDFIRLSHNGGTIRLDPGGLGRSSTLQEIASKDLMLGIDATLWGGESKAANIFKPGTIAHNARHSGEIKFISWSLPNEALTVDVVEPDLQLNRGKLVVFHGTQDEEAAENIVKLAEIALKLLLPLLIKKIPLPFPVPNIVPRVGVVVGGEATDDGISVAALSDEELASAGSEFVNSVVFVSLGDGVDELVLADTNVPSAVVDYQLWTSRAIEVGTDPSLGPVRTHAGLLSSRHGNLMFDRVETVHLSNQLDRVIVDDSIEAVDDPILLSGGEAPSGSVADALLADLLDLSTADQRIIIGNATDGAGAELFEEFAAQLSGSGRMAWNVVLHDTAGEQVIFSDATNIRFTDFEHVIGSAHDDVLDLRQLNPNGALSAGDASSYDAIRSTKISFAGGPNAIASTTNSLVTQAGAITQNQQEVLIEGGAGKDILVGTFTGENRILGGAGNDALIAGGFTSELRGGDGIDLLIGGGMQSQLYGEGGTDIFSLAHHTFVMDATTEDHVMWGPFQVTGGFQQAWQEGAWAYWAPLSTLLSYAPLPFLNSFGQVLGTATVLLDAITSSTLRFGQTGDGQLIIQMARGRAGQAVINNYSVDIDTGAATGNVVVGRLEYSATNRKKSLAELTADIKVILKSGFGVSSNGTDPLVLDLDGDGLELIRSDASRAYFDIDGDNFAERTAWVKGDDGLLARDLNANGRIDGISELFGDATTPGFTALATLDSNADGKISAADAAFSTLRVWRDLDGDGTTDAGELKTLAETGITQISLATTAPTAGVIRGNTIRAESTFTRTDGTTSKIADVVLDVVQTDTVYLGDATVSAAAAALPQLKGYGNIVDLGVAATGNPGLLSLLQSFDALPVNTSLDAMKAAAATILFRWAGVEGVAPTAMGGGSFDQQKLAFLEKYAGQQLTPRLLGGVPYEGNLSELVQTWDNVLADVTARLALQGPLQAVLSIPAFDVANDRFVSPLVTTLAEAYRAAIQQLPTDPAQALTEWTTKWGPLLSGFGDALIRPDGNAVRADFAVQSLVRATSGITTPLTLTQFVAGLGLDNVQIGSNGADTLGRAGSGINVYVGGAGNDVLTGGFGQDVYVYDRNFGQDTIVDVESAAESGDRIRFATLTASEVTMKREGLNLVITVKATGDKITVIDQYETPVIAWNGIQVSPDKGIEEIQFADGQIFEAVDIAAEVGLGTNGNDTIDGAGGQDVIEGLLGNDLLRGGENGDSYFYTRGDGADVIQDITNNPLLNAGDTLFLLGMTQSDLRITRNGASDDVLLTFSWGGGDSVLLDDQFAYTVLGYQSKLSTNTRVENIVFDHGSGMNWLDLQQLTISNYTTGGDDITYGFGTSDQFTASAGTDTLIGFDGGDTYRFGIGSGQDTIHDQSRYPEEFAFSGFINYSWGQDDIVEFGAGVTAANVQFSRTGAAPDLLITIDGYADSLTIKNQFYGQKLDLFGFLGIAWFDRVEAFRFADGTTLSWEQVLLDITTGTDGNDGLYGAYYRDTLDGKAGDDYLSGENDSDIYLFGRGYGSDTIEDNQTDPLTASIDTLKFGAGIAVNDITFERDGQTLDLVVKINGTTDQVRLKNQYYVLETGVFGPQPFDRVDIFQWADGTVKTWAQVSQQVIDAMRTAGDDLILGSHEGDRIDGGAGNDLLKGGNGNDIYVFNRGYGQDIVEDGRNDILAGAIDAVEFAAGVLSTDVDVLRAAGDDIALRIRDTGDTLTLKNQDDPSIVQLGTIESVRFSGGTTWDEATLRQKAISSQQTAGADTVRGFHVNDVIDGGAGNDTLLGAEGDDTYRFGTGFGNDRVEEILTVSTKGGNDTIEFLAGITPASVTLSRPANTDDLVLTVGTNSITIKNQFAYTPVFGFQNDIERIVFADGTVWTDEFIRTTIVAQTQTSGIDTVRGFASADVIDGGAGNDLLQGGTGGDIYKFGFGSGHDVIDETIGLLPLVAGADSVEFGAGIVRSNVVFSRVGDDLVATLTGGNDSLTIKSHFAAGYAIGSPKIEFFRFSNNWLVTAAQAEVNGLGSDATNSQTINGTTGADTLDGGVGSDTLIGSSGSDTYVFGRGYGADTVDDRNADSTPMGASTDTVAFAAGVVAEDLILSYVGNDLIMTVAGTGDVLTVKGQFTPTSTSFRPNTIEQFVFADGTIWDEVEIQARVLTAQETVGNDIVRAFYTDDVLIAGAGNDTLQGRDGSDVYRFGSGFGQDVIIETVDSVTANEDDVIEFTIATPSDITISRPANSDDLLIGVVGSNSIRVQGQFTPYNSNPSRTDIDQIKFADGSVWTESDIRNRLLEQSSSAGNDLIVGFYTDDTLDGGTGNDILRGSDGSDTYIFGRGYGQDVVEESLQYNVLLQTPDTVQFTADVAPADVTFARVGDDLVASISGTADKITIKSHYQQGSNVYTRMEWFKFTDGTTVSAAEAEARAIEAQLTAGNDSVVGSNSGDLIDAAAGADTISGGLGSDTYIFSRGSGVDTVDDRGDTATGFVDTIQFGVGISAQDLILSRSGDDVIVDIAGTTDRLILKGQSPQFASTGFQLGNRIEQFSFFDGTSWSAEDLDRELVLSHGTAGSDTVYGAFGSDVIDGLAGSDLLRGGLGGDTYIFGLGYGLDTIDDADFTNSDVDQIVFKAGVRSSQIEFSSVGEDVTLRIAGTSDSLTIKNQLLSVANYDRIEFVRFTDDPAVQWSAAELLTRLFAGSAANDLIGGTTGSETISGQDGNDQLTGRDGNDTLVGGNGDDILNGGNGSDSLNGGAGFDTASYADAITVVVDLVTPTNSTLEASGDTYTSIERFVLSRFNDRFVGSTQNDTVDAGAANDSVDGGSGNDAIEGGAGNDTLIGGVGVDTVSYSTATQGVTVSLGISIAQNTIGAGTDTLSGFESVIGSAFADAISGSAGVSNILSGEGGDDTYTIEDAGDLVQENANAGVDSVRSGIAHTLAANVENLTITGSTAVAGTGNTSANVLDGSQNTAANALAGLAGDDTYIVGAGDTVTEISNGGTDTVRSSVSFTLGANIENLILLGSAAINGTGNTLNNTIVANNANNVLNGGTGTDTLSFAAALSGVTVSLAVTTAQATGGSGSDTISAFENLIGSLYNDSLIGTTGNNTLDGGGGTDSLSGGTGNDTYFTDGSDTIIEAASGGTDLVLSSVSHILALNVENLTLTGNAAINGTGNTLNNTIIASDANNVLDGLGGTDTLSYASAAAAVTISLALTTDQVTGGSGIDRIAGFENLTGSVHSDVLTGSTGNNVIDGGLGSDSLTGGAGNDTFFFSQAIGATNVDTILDFSVPNDTIRLENTGTGRFNALTTTGTLAAAAFKIGAGATDADDRVIYNSATGEIFYDADGNGALVQIRFAIVSPSLAMTNADFTIV
ncbi:MAG: calcium-binding protein [Hyphomicrobiaceae bacterium]|nr:calcium-binding protein [Hyphomicrobiaceae bacterium]